MRITLVIASLLLGGAQRVMVTMANYWASKGWTVHLITLAHGSEAPFYELHPAVIHQQLDLGKVSKNPVQAIYNNMRRVWALRFAIKRSDPQVLIAFETYANILTILASVGFKRPVIISERINPYAYAIGRYWSALRSWLYPKATYVVVQNEAIRRYFSPAVQLRSHIIPNPVTLPHDTSERPGAASGQAPKKVIGMGRLAKEKGFDLLIQAFAMVAPKHEHWSLEIWGEGYLRSDLEVLIATLGLAHRVGLPGSTLQPAAKMLQADLFVLSSRAEGFPNVLCEAMACGLPVISFDCPSGPREIIRDGIDGVLVPAGDVHELATVMDRLMSDAQARQHLSSHAPAVLERFGLEKIMRSWEELVYDAVSEQSAKQKAISNI